MVLHDRARASLDGKTTSNLEDHILRRRPPAERSGEAHTNHLRPTDVPREAGHHVNRVGTADTDGDHAETAGVRRVAIGADHHPAREGVVLQDDLVDDARTRTPEPEAVLGRDGAKEVVDLAVGVDRDTEIDRRPHLGLDQMVAVHRRRDRRLGQTGRHELQQRHLGGGILHCDAIGMEVGVRDTPLQVLTLRIGQMVDENLLGEGQRSAESA